MVGACETSRFFRACGRPGIAICQYCGSSFCAEHGERLPDGQEICSRNECDRKREDLAHHFAYLEAVEERNRTGLCGQPDCDAALRVACAKCKGLFCLTHLHERTFNLRDGRPARGLICAHCHKRRKVWFS